MRPYPDPPSGGTLAMRRTFVHCMLPCFFHRGMCGTTPLFNPAYWDKLAAGIAKGILAYLGMDAVEQLESGEPDQPSPWAKEAWEEAVAAAGVGGWLGWVVVAWIGCMLMDLHHRLRRRSSGGGVVQQVRLRRHLAQAGQRDGRYRGAILDVVIGHLLANLPGVELPFAYTVLLCPPGGHLVHPLLIEAGSIIENAGALGAPVPGWLRKMIAALEQKVENAGNGIAGKEE